MDSSAHGPATATGSASQEHGTVAGARRPSVAVIGAGVSSLTAAYLLSRSQEYPIERARREFGLAPAVSFEEGTKRTIQWLKGNIRGADGLAVCP